MIFALLSMVFADSGPCVEDSGVSRRWYENGICFGNDECEFFPWGECYPWETVYYACGDGETTLCFDCASGGDVAHVLVHMTPSFLLTEYYAVDGSYMGQANVILNDIRSCCEGQLSRTFIGSPVGACLNPTPAVDPEAGDSAPTKVSATGESDGGDCGGGQAMVVVGILALLGRAALRGGRS